MLRDSVLWVPGAEWCSSDSQFLLTCQHPPSSILYSTEDAANLRHTCWNPLGSLLEMLYVSPASPIYPMAPSSQNTEVAVPHMAHHFTLMDMCSLDPPCGQTLQAQSPCFTLRGMCSLGPPGGKTSHYHHSWLCFAFLVSPASHCETDIAVGGGW